MRVPPRRRVACAERALTRCREPWYAATSSVRARCRVFCPSCGVEDRQQGQFCRACGGELRPVRTDAVSAREEIGRAVAAKIADLRTAKELKKVVEEVLPHVEKFLETPEQRRLRRIRSGTVMSGIGIGAMVFFALVATQSRDALPMIGVGAVVLLIGLATLLNGWHFSSRAGADRESEGADALRDLLGVGAGPARLSPPPSVVEHTTRQLETGETGAPRSRATE